MIDISSLFVESYITDLGDTVDAIYLLFSEYDPPSVVTREHSYPHFHSLLDHSFEVDMIVDTLIQYLEEVTFYSKETLESLIHNPHSSLVDPGFSF